MIKFLIFVSPIGHFESYSDGDRKVRSSGPAPDQLPTHELVFQKQGNSFRRHLYSIGYTHIFKFLHNKKNFVINSFWVDRPLQWNLPFTSNLCNPFKHHLRCASLYGVDFIFKRERREKRAQGRSCLKGLQRLYHTCPYEWNYPETGWTEWPTSSF